MLAKRTNARENHILACNFARYSPIFKKFFTRRLSNKPFLIWLLTTPPHLKYVVTLPGETLMSAKQAINDKLQGSIAVYLRRGGVVNNQIKKGLLLSAIVKKN